MPINFDWSKWLTSTVPGILILGVTATFLAFLIKYSLRLCGKLLKALALWLIKDISPKIIVHSLSYYLRPYVIGYVMANKYKDGNNPTALLAYGLCLCTALLTKFMLWLVVCLVSAYYIIIEGHHDYRAVILICLVFIGLNILFRDTVQIDGALRSLFVDDLEAVRKDTNTFKMSIDAIVKTISNSPKDTKIPIDKK